MTEQSKDFPEFYLTRPQPCPYLPDRLERKLFTHLGSEKSVAHFNFLHHDGFRRSQTIAYRPHCDGCSACVSVRIVASQFQRSKSQKRVWNSNKEISVHRGDAFSSAEQYALFKDYVETRHGDGGMADMTLFEYQAMIEDSLVDSFVVEYRRKSLSGCGKSDLIGVALCDRLSDGVSLVYSFFDPALSQHSMGTYIILETVDYAASIGEPFVYLGYWVKGSPKMDYKIKFLPQDHLIAGEWQRVDRVEKA